MPASGHSAGKGHLGQFSCHVLKDESGDCCVVEDSQRFLHQLLRGKEFPDLVCVVQGRKKLDGITHLLDLLAQGVTLCFIEIFPIANQFPDGFGMTIKRTASEGQESIVSTLPGRWLLLMQFL